MKRDLLSLQDWTQQELLDCLSLAAELKALGPIGPYRNELAGRSYALIFQKNSLRTRVSFEVGISELGGSSMYLTDQDFKLGERESVADTAKVLSRYVDGILIRTYSHNLAKELGENSSVPVINMLTDFCHPCQILADVMTIQENFKDLSETPICYLGDGNNIVHSWLNFASRVPINFTIGTNERTLPDLELVEYSKQKGVSEVKLIYDPVEAVQDAKILYTDVWASMGEKEKANERRQLLMPYQINSHILSKAAPGAKIMHCLPAERGWEITSEVLDGPQSIVLDQAENRLHAQKAILLMLDRWFRS
tara:strand:- start:987 stop:1910 length:924 start_codon:yes stop_codon:yes gene_type:complete